MGLLWISLLAVVVFALLMDWVSGVQRAAPPRGGAALGHKTPPPGTYTGAERRTQSLPFVGQERRAAAAETGPVAADSQEPAIADQRCPESPRRAA